LPASGGCLPCVSTLYPTAGDTVTTGSGFKLMSLAVDGGTTEQFQVRGPDTALLTITMPVQPVRCRSVYTPSLQRPLPYHAMPCHAMRLLVRALLPLTSPNHHTPLASLFPDSGQWPDVCAQQWLCGDLGWCQCASRRCRSGLRRHESHCQRGASGCRRTYCHGMAIAIVGTRRVLLCLPCALAGPWATEPLPWLAPTPHHATLPSLISALVPKPAHMYPSRTHTANPTATCTAWRLDRVG
jgi:hypothetical protein